MTSADDAPDAFDWRDGHIVRLAEVSECDSWLFKSLARHLHLTICLVVPLEPRVDLVQRDAVPVTDRLLSFHIVGRTHISVPEQEDVRFFQLLG